MNNALRSARLEAKDNSRPGNGPRSPKVSGGAAYERAAPRVGDWQEIAWPFPRDGWPAGRAFRCGGGACGGVELYVRPKKGFCNCDTGVADDDEVDRVADMPGRLRAYDLDMQDGSRRAAIGIAVSRRCDLLVAVAQGKASAAEVRRAALEHLGSGDMTRWMNAAMEGR